MSVKIVTVAPIPRLRRSIAVAAKPGRRIV
jgi:hypothetical protein